MKALIQCGGRPEWAAELGQPAWTLLPAGNRPLLEYWMELCVALGIRDVKLLLGDGAEFVEAYAGEGERWGLSISYGFLKDGQSAASYLRRSPAHWRDGLLFVGAPVFPQRLREGWTFSGKVEASWVARNSAGEVVCLLSPPGAALDAFCASGVWTATGADSFESLGLAVQTVDSVRDYYELNMRLVRGEVVRYLSPGYYAADGSYVGYNVVLPPAAKAQPPLMVGNDCRLAPLSSVGPDVVMGSRVVVDSQSTLTRCVVLDGTYVGRGLEIDGKIVAGRRLVDPESGAAIDIADPWLLAELGPAARLTDLFRAVGGWILALVLVVVQAIPFALLFPLVKGRGGRFSWKLVRGVHGVDVRFPVWNRPPQASFCATVFRALGLDLYPRLGMVLMGNLWLCGQSPLRMPEEEFLQKELPHYHPAAISDADTAEGETMVGLREVAIRYYGQEHSPMGDLRLWMNFYWNRLLGSMTETGAPSVSPED